MDGIDLVQEICISGLDFSLLNRYCGPGFVPMRAWLRSIAGLASFYCGPGFVLLRAWLPSDEQAGLLHSTLLYSKEVYLCILPENTQGINNFSFLWFESLSVGSGSNSRE